jgi:hypothetical protein
MQLGITAAPGSLRVRTGSTPPRSHLTMARPPIGGHAHRWKGPRRRRRSPPLTGSVVAWSAAVQSSEEESEKEKVRARVYVSRRQSILFNRNRRTDVRSRWMAIVARDPFWSKAILAQAHSRPGARSGHTSHEGKGYGTDFRAGFYSE